MVWNERGEKSSFKSDVNICVPTLAGNTIWWLFGPVRDSRVGSPGNYRLFAHCFGWANSHKSVIGCLFGAGNCNYYDRKSVTLVWSVNHCLLCCPWIKLFNFNEFLSFFIYLSKGVYTRRVFAIRHQRHFNNSDSRTSPLGASCGTA